jgi:uncharacterized protein YuzE
VDLTEERGRHIVENHPDLLPEHRQRIADTLAEPDEVRRSVRFSGARLFARWYDVLRGGKHAVVAEARGRTCGMEAKLTFKYDREGDILYINKRPPYAEQDSEELDDGVIARLNPATGEIENLEVLFFSTRLLRTDLFELPVTADLRLAVKP